MLRCCFIEQPLSLQSIGRRNNKRSNGLRRHVVSDLSAFLLLSHGVSECVTQTREAIGGERTCGGVAFFQRRGNEGRIQLHEAGNSPIGAGGLDHDLYWRRVRRVRRGIAPWSIALFVDRNE